ncbi:unnamed protein product, partial [Symbiodinium sp. KB8]
MSKTPFSADYIHKLLKTIPEAERSKFLEMLETQPIIEQQPASSSAATPALAAAPQPAVTAPQTLDEFCDTVAQEAYVQPPPAAPVAPPPQKSKTAPTPSNSPAGAAAPTATPAASKTPVPQKQPPPKPTGTPAADPASTGPPPSHNKAPPPPLILDEAPTGPASTPPAQGATSEPERAPTLAADAPASRVGSIINDGSSNPSLCLVQLWACRKKCGSCENAFCQATFPDRSNSFHTLHRCRDCKRAEGRNRANQPAPASSDEGWHQSNWEWNSDWSSGAWTPAWGSQDLGTASPLLVQKVLLFAGPSALSNTDVSVMSEFSQLALEASVPAEVMQLLSEFEVATFARCCTSHAEAEDMITQLCADSGLVEHPSKLLAKASLRLLLSRCRAAEALPSLEQHATLPSPASIPTPPLPTATPPTPASSGWQESWPAKLSPEKTAALRRRFEEDYPTELLDSESFPSSRLLALTSKMIADREIRWLPWKFRLSSKSQDDNLLLRPKKQPRLSELSDLLLDDAPTREIHDGPASYAFISQMLSLASTSIALCQGAHLGALKMYNKKFLQLCFTKYESASNLRGPTSLEAQAADKRAWEILSDLVNQHSWKLDDALHEVSEVRSDLASLLAPRPHVSKRMLEGQDQWRYRPNGRGRGAQSTGRGGKGRDGKGHPTERFERGGKGKTSQKGGDKHGQAPQGKWLSTIFMDGKKHTLCMRYQSGQCKDPASCRYVHKCAVPKQVHLISPHADASEVSPVARAIADHHFDFSTCLSLLEESFSSQAASALQDPAVTQSDAYFNLGAFGFDGGKFGSHQLCIALQCLFPRLKARNRRSTKWALLQWESALTLSNLVFHSRAPAYIVQLRGKVTDGYSLLIHAKVLIRFPLRSHFTGTAHQRDVLAGAICPGHESMAGKLDAQGNFLSQRSSPATPRLSELRYAADQLKPLRLEWRNWPRREGETDEGHQLLVCEGNWQGAESDPALLQELIEEELQAGFLEEVDSIEEAYRRWGKDRVAVGRVNIVKAP